MSYLEDARTALTARLAELEDEARRTRTALEAITPGSEEDAAARYRQPGVHKDRISARVRKSFDSPSRHARRNSKGMLVSAGQKHFLSVEQDAELQKMVLEVLDREGMKRRELEAKVLPRVSFTFTTTNLLRRLRELEQQGLIERYPPTGNNAHLVWRLPTKESAAQNGSQFATAVSQSDSTPG